MDEDKLNKWAAEYIGEDAEMVADAVEAKWYTKSPGAALALFYKAASEGKKGEISIEDGKVEVEVGGCTETGSIDELPLLITRSCYRCYGG